MSIVCFALTIAGFILFARVIVSLIQAFGALPDALHPVARVLYDITEPVLAPLRRIVPRIGMIDITPIVAILLMNVIQATLEQTLTRIP